MGTADPPTSLPPLAVTELIRLTIPVAPPAPVVADGPCLKVIKDCANSLSTLELDGIAARAVLEATGVVEAV
ncbi:hypothetical protein FRC00_006597, partial [Tulasnella sp. 408]